MCHRLPSGPGQSAVGCGAERTKLIHYHRTGSCRTRCELPHVWIGPFEGILGAALTEKDLRARVRIATRVGLEGNLEGFAMPANARILAEFGSPYGS
jgi:hypothetical protein